MKKILILGTGRTASKFYKEILKKNPEVCILHEIMFDFRLKTDIHSVFKKHNVYQNKEGLSSAFEEIYSKSFFRNLKDEYPDKDALISAFNALEEITWESSFNLLLEEKARLEDKSITGAKNPVHFTLTAKILKRIPDVNILYLMRDPRAIYASELPMKTKTSKLSQFPRIRNSIVQRILIFLYTNLEWIGSMIMYKRVKRRVLLCKYEELVTNREALVEKVFNYCGLPFKKEYLDQVGVIGSSHVKNTEAGVSAHGFEKWKELLNGFEKFWFKLLILIFNYR